MNDKILLTNIQRFSIHDGPGIRTTVFLKGCSLSCPWCSNPENLLPQPQEYIKDGLSKIYGSYYFSDELLHEVLKDKIFYIGKLSQDDWCISSANQIDSLPGGVTFSGGECLLQIKALIPVCEKLKKAGIHTVAETCLFVPADYLILALEYIDFFYVDIKILDYSKCKSIEHGNLNFYLSNLNTLLNWKDAKGHRKPVVVRIPVIGSYTDDEMNRRIVYELLKKYRNKILKIELIKEHNLGESKYKSLNMKIDYHGVEDSLLETYKTELLDLEIPIEICKI